MNEGLRVLGTEGKGRGSDVDIRRIHPPKLSNPSCQPCRAEH